MLRVLRHAVLLVLLVVVGLRLGCGALPFPWPGDRAALTRTCGVAGAACATRCRGDTACATACDAGVEACTVHVEEAEPDEWQPADAFFESCQGACADAPGCSAGCGEGQDAAAADAGDRLRKYGTITQTAPTHAGDPDAQLRDLLRQRDLVNDLLTQVPLSERQQYVGPVRFRWRRFAQRWRHDGHFAYFVRRVQDLEAFGGPSGTATDFEAQFTGLGESVDRKLIGRLILQRTFPRDFAARTPDILQLIGQPRAQMEQTITSLLATPPAP